MDHRLQIKMINPLWANIIGQSDYAIEKQQQRELWVRDLINIVKINSMIDHAVNKRDIFKSNDDQTY